MTQAYPAVIFFALIIITFQFVIIYSLYSLKKFITKSLDDAYEYIEKQFYFTRQIMERYTLEKKVPFETPLAAPPKKRDRF